MTKDKISHIEKALNIWAIVLIVWSFYRVKFGTTLPIWFDEFIAKPIIFLGPVFYFIKKVEEKSFFKSLGFVKKNFLKESSIGLLISVIFFSVFVFVFYSKGFFKNFNFVNAFSIIPILYLLITSFATSFSEEILSRGFILFRLNDHFKNIFTSSFCASILYFFIHIPILFTDKSLTGDLLIKVATVEFLLGFILSLIFLLRKNIIIPIFIHAFYNFCLWLLI